MNKENLKNEIREGIEDLINGMKLVSAMIEVEFPGCSHLVFDVIAEEVEKLRKKPEPEQGCTEDSTRNNASQCRCNEAMTFGDALYAMKQGKSVARKGWNGKNQFVELATGISYKGNSGEIVNVHHNDIGNKALAFIGTSGVQMGWLASQADMLAEDWYIVE